MKYCTNCQFAGLDVDEEPCGGCIDFEYWTAINPNYNLTLIEKPFGLLDKETQDRLKKVWNGKIGGSSNIQCYYIDNWKNMGNFYPCYAYRLDPAWKEEVPTKEVDQLVTDVMEAFDRAIKILEECEKP